MCTILRHSLNFTLFSINTALVQRQEYLKCAARVGCRIILSSSYNEFDRLKTSASYFTQRSTANWCWSCWQKNYIMTNAILNTIHWYNRMLTGLALIKQYHSNKTLTFPLTWVWNGSVRAWIFCLICFKAWQIFCNEMKYIKSKSKLTAMLKYNELTSISALMSLEKGVWLLKYDTVSSVDCLRTLGLSVSGILSISIEVSSSSGF